MVPFEKEADVKIAIDTIDGDIVISGYSDLFIYQNITMLWQPTRHGGFIEYKKANVLSALGLQSTEQLSTLGLVSTNDYGHSVYGLGYETNSKVIKVQDVPTLVAEYLADKRVAIKKQGSHHFWCQHQGLRPSVANRHHLWTKS